MAKILYEGALILTVDRQDTVHRSGWLLVEDDRIAGLGEGTCPLDTADAEVVDARGLALIPGIVDAHTHVAGSLFKGLIEDDSQGFYGFALPMEGSLTREDVYHLSLLGAWECLQSGITTVNEIYHYSLEVAKALDAIGMRAVVSQNIVDVNIGALRYNDYTRYPALGQGFLDENEQLIRTYHGRDNGRITCRVGPHATDTVSMELAKRCVDLAERYGVGFHTHVAQSEREVALVREQYGMTPVEYLCEAGLAGERMMAAHCIYVTEADVAILARTRTHMVHCAEALGRNGNMPPTPLMFRQGVDLVLGTDWLTQDAWANMRAGIFLNRRMGVPRDLTSARSMLRRSTIDAARALGLGDRVGSLEVGKQADIVALDIAGPDVTPMFHDPAATLVYNASRYNVRRVMVAGKTVVDNGQLTTLCAADVTANGRKVAGEVYDRHLASMS